jgi:hypothetical protein
MTASANKAGSHYCTSPSDRDQHQRRGHSRVRWRLQFTLKSGIGEGNQKEKKERQGENNAQRLG